MGGLDQDVSLLGENLNIDELQTLKDVMLGGSTLDPLSQESILGEVLYYELEGDDELYGMAINDPEIFDLLTGTPDLDLIFSDDEVLGSWWSKRKKKWKKRL